MAGIGSAGSQESKDKGFAALDAAREWRDLRYRRRFRRYEFGGRVQVSKTGASKATWGLCSDLGEGGLGATIVGDLAVGDTVWLHLSFPGSSQTIDVRAIVRYRDLHHCGFEFLTLTENQHQVIRENCQELTLP